MAKQPKEADVTITLMLTAEQARRLEQYKERFGLSMSEIVRRALPTGLDTFETAMDTMERMLGKKAS